MNEISGNRLYPYRSTQQASKQNHVWIRNSNPKGTEEKFYDDIQTVNSRNSGISRQEAYERLSGSGKILQEESQDEAYNEKFMEVSDVNQLASQAGLSSDIKVTETGVVSLSNGVSFYFDEGTGEVSCVSHNDSHSGKHVLWSKTFLPEDMIKCDKLFDNYKDIAAGHIVFRYRAYLKHEEFWDMYLNGRVDLSTLIESDDMLSEDELYNKFIQDTEKIL